MSLALYIFVAVFCVQSLHAVDFSMEKEEMRAVQDRLIRLEGIEKVYKAFMAPEEDRDEKCLGIGEACTFGSGPNCCGVRTRCIIWDHTTSPKTRGGAAVWHSACREYNGGVALDEIIKFFEGIFGG